MSRLFIELYLDEDVHVIIADLLRGRGFAATTARDEGQLEKTDEEQLAYAVSQQKTLLTHNRHDFEALAREYASLGRLTVSPSYFILSEILGETAVHV